MSVNIGDTIQDGSVVWRVLSKDCNLRLLTKNEDYVTDLNDTIKIGIYRTHGDNKTANTPPNIGEGGGYGVCIVTPISTNTPNNVIQLFYSAHGSTLWQRQKKGDDGWTSWQRLTTASEIVDSMSLGTDGYVKFGSLLNGLIIQWGFEKATSTTHTMNYPISFPHRRFAGIAQATTSSNTYCYFDPNSGTNTTATINVPAANIYFYWLAIGY